MPEKRFGYYDRLGPAQRKIYRASDAVTEVVVPDATVLRPLVVALEAALGAGKRGSVTRAAKAFVDTLLGQVNVPRVDVRVREVRPQIQDGELHGLYTFGSSKKAPRIEVWMRTAAHEKIVRFRTFFRTLLHEVVHHLDLTLLGLGESFHTRGFFQRESSLVRQLLPRGVAKPKPKPRPRARGDATTPKPKPKPAQLSLFDES
jgi:hypothetical protein